MAMTTLSGYLHLFLQQIKTVLECDHRELTYKMRVVKCLTAVY